MRVKGLIVEVSDSYEYIENISKEYMKRRLNELKPSRVTGKVIDEKIFSLGDLERTNYYVLKCDDGNTYIHKLRIESGGSWSITVKSDVEFEKINSYESAAEAFTKSFLKVYPANCAFLIP